jgi:heme o synthase
MVITAVMTAWAAGGPWVSPAQVLALAVAGALTAGGAAAINHYWDRDIDARMVRTAGRPLPSGRFVIPEVALAWGALLVTSGLTLAVHTLPPEAAGFILLGFLIYVPLYTCLLKRRTPWNVIIGGAAGSCPVLAGWATVRGDWPLAPLALAALVFFWTPAHFWAYAMANEEDYRGAGVPMLPAIVGSPATPPYILAHAIPAIVAAAVALASLPAGLLSASGVIAGLASLVFLGVCLSLYQDSGRARAKLAFHTSNSYLAIVFIAVALGARA